MPTVRSHVGQPRAIEASPTRLLLTGTECTLDTGNGKTEYWSDGNGYAFRWYAFHTRARHEKRVSSRLKDRGFEAYLPLVPRTRQWHDRKKVIDWPLFPSYVFARSSIETLVRVLDTPGVAGVVRMAGQPVPVPDEDIENVRLFTAAIVATGEAPEPEPLVEEGQLVRVISGPLDGVEGLVVERRGGGRALVQVGLKAIGQGLKVEVVNTALRILSVGEWSSSDGRRRTLA